MWNEMVKDEEISFSGEESAHPGMAQREITAFIFPSVVYRFTHCCHLFMLAWYIFTRCLRTILSQGQGWHFNPADGN